MSTREFCLNSHKRIYIGEGNANAIKQIKSMQDNIPEKNINNRTPKAGTEYQVCVNI